MASKCDQKFETNQVIYIDNSGPLGRPMNAFLIFCKRQRGSVRRKYPFLENCEVSRVLGEWWAALGTADKSLYSVLANQHKENLVRNHSEVKWFKPKMPGGTKVKKLPEANQTGIVPGKLADESQLGGLSSLLQRDKEEVLKEEKPPLPKPLKKRYRDEIYLFEDTKPIVEPVVEEKPEEKTEIERPPSETNEEERLKMWRTHILEENNNVKQSRDRACKGQRYREFMWTNYSNRRRANRWELNQDKHEVIPTKKPKTVESESSNKTSKISDTDEKADNSISSDVDSNISKAKKRKVTKNNKNAQTKAYCENDASVISKVNSETDSSIDKGCEESLPLSDSDNSSNSCSSKDERKEDTITGSRKRKIRKQDIRRLEPGSIFNGVDVIADNDLPKL